MDTGEEVFSHEPDRVLSTASIAKIFLLHAALKMKNNGELRLDERLTRNAAERVDESGIWYLLDQPDLTIHDVGMLIGAFSDLDGGLLLR
ncbi:class A beta-lactamase-related serine hydrolase, partial [Brevibacterium paucivorans]|uniref:class A beta-lactamase-related serine hydrolase n=1 Tax=Brevibacterium paucivorans TaxID=170994 RepID=UPI002155AD55